MSDINYHRQGSGPPLLLMHGIGMSWHAFAPVLPRLAHERDVIAIDLPGFGGSPRPPAGTPAGVETLTRLVIEFLDGLGLEKPDVAGNSLGGWIALELAKAGRARTATALSPGGFYLGRERKFVDLSLNATLRMGRALAPVAELVTKLLPLRMLVLGQMYARPWRVPAADAAQALQIVADSTWFPETAHALASGNFTGGEQIKVPVTIAWGQHDRLLWLRQAPRAAAWIPGAKLVTLYGCGHLPMSDDPEQVARVILEGAAGA